MTNVPAQQVCFVVQPPGTGDSFSPVIGASPTATDQQVVTIPEGPSVLRLEAGRIPRCEPIVGEGTRRAQTTTSPRTPDQEEAIVTDGVVLEPVTHQGRRRLVAVLPERSRARVNGQPAPRLAVLREKDVLQLNGGVTLHVTLFSRVVLGPPSPELLGKECPVCRVPFSAATTCYVCVCGTGLHLEPDASEGLQCARMRPDCPRCRRPVVLSEGYSYLPSEE